MIAMRLFVLRIGGRPRGGVELQRGRMVAEADACQFVECLQEYVLFGCCLPLVKDDYAQLYSFLLRKITTKAILAVGLRLSVMAEPAIS